MNAHAGLDFPGRHAAHTELGWLPPWGRWSKRSATGEGSRARPHAIPGTAGSSSSCSMARTWASVAVTP